MIPGCAAIQFRQGVEEPWAKTTFVFHLGSWCARVSARLRETPCNVSKKLQTLGDLSRPTVSYSLILFPEDVLTPSKWVVFVTAHAIGSGQQNAASLRSAIMLVDKSDWQLLPCFFLCSPLVLGLFPSWQIPFHFTQPVSPRRDSFRQYHPLPPQVTEFYTVITNAKPFIFDRALSILFLSLPLIWSRATRPPSKNVSALGHKFTIISGEY